MKFFALLDPKSAIARDWKERSRLGGVIDDIIFSLVNRNYISKEITEEQIKKVLARQDRAIILEVLHILPNDIETKSNEKKQEMEISIPNTENECIKVAPRILPVVEKSELAASKFPIVESSVPRRRTRLGS